MSEIVIGESKQSMAKTERIGISDFNSNKLTFVNNRVTKQKRKQLTSVDNKFNNKQSHY